MNITRVLSLCFAFLIHLQATAGELIKVTGVEQLNPTISVTLSATELKLVSQNVDEEGKKILSLHLMQNGKRAIVGVAGYYSLNNDVLSYNPYYGLGYERSYEIIYHKDGKEYTKLITTPQHPTSAITSTVVTTYPMADTIPYNTLFFHIRFSQPMMDDKQAYRHIKIYDDKGVERERAWRQKSFWLDDGKLLVLMIHPGRVKNGIHFESPLFDSGRTYTVVVPKDIQDINGNPIAAEYTRSYYVKGEDRNMPKASLTATQYTISNSQQPIVLTFSEGMDHASVTEGITIVNEQGDNISFNITATDDKHYSIAPASNWSKGKYTLILNGSVYDYAANRINRLFEITNIEEMEKDKIETKFPFTIK